MQKVKAVTHAGLFHADEVFAVAELLMLFEVQLERTILRDKDLEDYLSDYDGFVLDIGRKRDPINLQYDHHHTELTRIDGYPYATAGLIWADYGHQIVRKYYPDSDIDLIWKWVDEKLIKGIDAHDDDAAYELNAVCKAGEVEVKSLSNVISTYNHTDVNDHDEQYIRFAAAVDLATVMLKSEMDYAAKVSVSLKGFEATFDGELCIMDKGGPWQHAIDLKHPYVLYVLAPSNHPGSPYSLTAVPVKPGSRKVKAPILRGDFTGFIHKGQWIAGGEKDDLIKLAKYNINAYTTNF